MMAIAGLAVSLSGLVGGCAAGDQASVPPPSSSPTTTGASVSIEELGAGVSDALVELDVPGPAAITYRRITIPPGAGTGPHCHYGQLLGLLEAGELTHRAPIYPGGVHVYRAGETILEGPSYVHEGVNEGTDDVVLLVIYVTEEGKPLAETDLARCAPTND